MQSPLKVAEPLQEETQELSLPPVLLGTAPWSNTVGNRGKLTMIIGPMFAGKTLSFE